MESTSEFVSEDLPLTPAQLGVWLAILRDPVTAVAYNLTSRLELCGNLDIDRLRRAIQIVVDQIPALRLQFFENPGRSTLSQRIRARCDLSIALVDLCTEVDPIASSEAWQEQERQRPFRLSDFPHFRLTVLRVAADRFLACGTYHHLIVDGLGVQLTARYIAQAYGALLRGEKPPRIDPHAHVDYLRSVTAYQSSPQFLVDQEYFLRVHRGGLPIASLSTRPQRRTSAAAPLLAERVSTTAVAQALHAFARSAVIPLSKLLIGVCVLLLHRLTGLSSVPIGLPVHGRGPGSAIARPIVWMCANVLPLRISCSSNVELADFLRSVTAQIDEALIHQSYPIHNLAQHLGDRTAVELYSVVVNVLRSGLDTRFGDLHAHATITNQGPIDDLSILIRDREGGRELQVQVQANPEMYQQWEVDAYAEALMCLLADIARDSDRPIGEFDLVPPGQPLASAETSERPVMRPVHQIIAAVADQHAGCIAAIANGQSITYADLIRRSNQLAHRLIKTGVKPGQVVAVADDRLIHTLIGMLAVLRAGAAYLPLDTELPSERMQLLLTDSSAVAILYADPAFMAAVQNRSVPTLYLDQQFDLLRGEAEGDPGIHVVADDLAYVIYTSGSTGMPKGVQVEHGSLGNVLTSMRDLLGLREQRFTMAAVSSLSFDISALELFLPLITGQTVAIASRHCARDGVQLRQFIDAHGVTLLQATPMTWRMLLLAGAVPRSLIALCGGERLSNELAQALTRTCREVWNLYGPTETTIWSLAYRLSEGSDPAIGFPLSNTSIAIVDRYLRKVPAGAVGELLIGGAGVARGYCNRADLTAEHFIRGPTGERQYLTGDLVRMRRDGALEFVGRHDGQLKIAGHRVEPGEIEAVISRIPGVRAAVVTARTKLDGDLQLVAHVQSDGFSPTELRDSLAAHLPRYMIPTAFVRVEHWPLTASGKVDRKALPPPEHLANAVEDRPARTAMEVEIHTIVAELLGHSSFGMQDSFTNLGGQSLAALQLVIELKQRCSVYVTVDKVLEAPSLWKLAETVDALMLQQQAQETSACA